MIDIYGLTNEQKKTVKIIIDAFKVANVTKERDDITKEKKNNDAWDLINFNVCSFDDICGIFTQDEINNELLKTLPNGVSHYDVRHNGMLVPVSIEKKVNVYKLGTLITCDKVNFDSKDYKKIYHYHMNGSRISYSQYIKSMGFSIISNSYRKGLKHVMNNQIMNNKIIMISPDYDLIGNNVEMTDSVPILVDKDNPFIPVYSCLWGKGWSTLSNPNTMKKYNRILFGKCNHDEIKLIRDATANTHLIVKREDIGW